MWVSNASFVVPLFLTNTFPVTRSATRALLVDIDLGDLLDAEEAAHVQCLEEGYDTDDSLIGEVQEGNDEEELELDAEFTQAARGHLDNAFDIDEFVSYDCGDIIEGPPRPYRL